MTEYPQGSLSLDISSGAWWREWGWRDYFENHEGRGSLESHGPG